jgi:hypothetical protein
VKSLRYEKGALAMDALRGGGGLALCVGPLVFVEDILTWVAAIFWILAAVFGVFVLKVVDRHKTEIQIGDDGITMIAPGRTRSIAWDRLERVKLSYFASKRARPGDGVMTMTLRGDGTKIVVDSALTEFDIVAEGVARVCGAKSLDVDPTTAHNFEALGAPIPRRD